MIIRKTEVKLRYLIKIFLIQTRLFHSYTPIIATTKIKIENNGKLAIESPKHTTPRIEGIPITLTNTRDLFDK